MNPRISDIESVEINRRTLGCWTQDNNVDLQPRKANAGVWPAGWGRSFCPSGKDPTWSTFSMSGSSTRHGPVQSGSRGGPQRRPEGWSSSPTMTGWDSWGCWEEKALERHYSNIPVFKRVLEKGGKGPFYTGRTRGNGFRIKEGRFRVERNALLKGGKALE